MIFASLFDARSCPCSGFPVIGVNELHIGPGQQFGDWKPQRVFPGRIEPFEIAIKPGDAEQIQR